MEHWGRHNTPMGRVMNKISKSGFVIPCKCVISFMCPILMTIGQVVPKIWLIMCIFMGFSDLWAGLCQNLKIGLRQALQLDHICHVSKF